MVARRDTIDGAADNAAMRDAIPLDLAALLTPYRQHRRLSLRVVQLPARAELSAGVRNEDASWSLTPEDLAIERNRADFTLLLAEVAGRVVGLCHGYRDEGTAALLNSVVVRPEQRGGIAAALVVRAIGALRALGNTHVTLNVVSTNEPATRLYT